MPPIVAAVLTGLFVVLADHCRAQGEYAAPVQQVQVLAQALADAMNAGDEARAAVERAAFEEGVDRFLAGELLATRDYNKAATMAMNVRCPEACQRIARHAIAKLQQPGQLREFLGVANFELAQHAETDAEMRALAAEAAGALATWCDEKPGSMGPRYLVHAYATLGDWKKALAWDDRLRERRSNIIAPPVLRAILLLGAEQWAEAIEQLRSEDVATAENRGFVAVLTSRAEALRGDAATAIAVARAEVERDATDAAVEALADVLAFQGKNDEALALLAKHPVTETSDDPRLLAGLRKSRAVLQYLISLRGKRPPDLRQQLGKMLEAKFAVLGAKDGEAVAKAMSSSPWTLAHAARKTPSGPAGWANDLLFAVCVRDVAKYTPAEAERKLLPALVDEATRTALTGPEAWEAARRFAASYVVLDEVPGALIVRQLLDKL